MNRLTLAAALAALTAATVPSATADGGLSCGFSGAGVASEGQLTVAGVLTGGPFWPRVTDGDTSVSIQCTVYVDHYGWPEVVAEAVSSPAPVGALGPVPVTFAVPANVDVDLYVCTEVTVRRGGQHEFHRHDADGNPSNGVQCSKAKAHDDDLVYVYSRPPTPMGGDTCAHVNHNQAGELGEIVCLPGGPI